LGDVNGDRLADLAVGLPAAADGAGQVVIVNGRGGDWAIPRLGASGYLDASNSIFTGVDGAGLGAVVAPAGDINGDGLSDFLIGDAANNRVYLIRGRIGNYGTESILDGAVDYLRQEFLPPAGMTIGNAVAAAGDVNGDNVDDFLIGATSATTGSVYLILGDVQTTESIPLDEAAGAIIATSSAGASIASVGDVNDDHIDDFAVGFGGQIYLFKGSQIYANGDLTALDLSDADHTFTSADSQPTIVRFNDLNADLIDDFGYTNGTVPQVILGNAAETYTPQGLNFAPAASGTLVAGGDVNRNGNADILVINAVNDLYIIDGGSLGSVQATIENVRTVASAPYARGADLNADDASDIAVMPSAGAAVLGMDALATAVNPTWLPEASPVLASVNNLGTVYVDDDYCSSCANDGYTWNIDAFDNIQSALDAGGMGDTVVINPGQYAPFTVSNDDVIISGVNADAVFIDGGGASQAVVINNADGVTLQQLTIRNAGTLLTLNDAGKFGWQDAAERTTLSYVLLQDFTTHAVWMTDDSTLHASDVTIVGIQNHIEVDNDGSETDPVNTQILTDTRAAVGVPGGIAMNDYLLYLPHDDGATDTLYEYTLNTGTWHNRGFAANSGGIITGTVYAAQEQSEGLSKNGFVVLRPAGEGYNGSISRINTGEGVWTRLDLGSWTDEFSEGLAAAYGTVYRLYILSGQTNNKFYRFDTAFYEAFSENQFTELAAPPETVGTGSALLVYGSGTDSTYALIGGGSKSLCEWTAVDLVDTGSWDCSLAQLPEAPGAGAALVSDGTSYGDNSGYFYAVIGGGSNKW
ncbi:MAG: hypothetical protein GY949_11670, partial [Gammaproteobacteria bacterium]|nr:hypothetical protein [Gammaproteobacteria bacterium]